MVTRYDFLDWLNKQIGSPYCWAGQGEKLFDVLKKALKEQFDQGEDSTQRMLNYMVKKNMIKDTALYDCSGLITYYLIKNGLLKSDCTANDLYNKCEAIKGDVKDGDFAFYLKSGKAYHVGVVQGDYVINAYNQANGVVKTKRTSGIWVYKRPAFAFSFDDGEWPEEISDYYRVRVAWDKPLTQLGAYHLLSKAKKMQAKHSGYYVFAPDGTKVC